MPSISMSRQNRSRIVLFIKIDLRCRNCAKYLLKTLHNAMMVALFVSNRERGEEDCLRLDLDQWILRTSMRVVVVVRLRSRFAAAYGYDAYVTQWIPTQLFNKYAKRERKHFETCSMMMMNLGKVLRVVVKWFTKCKKESAFEVQWNQI